MKAICYTDGSSLGNPGNGGWGAVILINEKVYETGGGPFDNTTNNKMEMLALIETLKFLNTKEIRDVLIKTDSKYLINGTESWIYNWQKNGWKTANKKPVLNQDLWQEILDLKNLFTDIKFQYVAGHTGIGGNERADEIARRLASKEDVILFNGFLSDYKIKV